MLRKLLCVGGPRDGQRLEIGDDQNYIEVLVRPDLPRYGDPVVLQTTVETVCYSRFLLSAGLDHRVVFLRPGGQATADTLEALVRGYGRLDGETRVAAADAAIRTLERVGYSWTGGQYWRPPLGKAPHFPEDGR